MNQDFAYSYSNLTFKEYLSKTFLLVACGLAISTLLGFLVSNNLQLFFGLVGRGYILLVIAELAIVIYFSSRIMKMSKTAAYACFFAYSILNGINLSAIFAVYDFGSIVYALGMTTVLFVCMSIIGHTTNVDLTKFSSLIFVGLIVIIIGGLINFLLRSSLFDWILSCFGVVLFLGLTAYDMQKIRHIYNETFSDSELSSKMIVYGALELYLDFINIFIRILSIFGRRKN